LRISVYEYEKSISITLEGRVAGPWVAELSRVWVETAPQLSSRKLTIDLRSVTYADSAGTEALKHIYAQSQAKLIASSPWTEYLAEEIRKNKQKNANEEVENANHV
jgi:anti-anti-sigma regulatory factor